MKWRFVFDAYQLKGARDFGQTIAWLKMYTDYQFFNWCGKIYHISGEYTGITVEDMI